MMGHSAGNGTPRLGESGAAAGLQSPRMDAQIQIRYRERWGVQQKEATQADAVQQRACTHKVSRKATGGGVNYAS